MLELNSNGTTKADKRQVQKHFSHSADTYRKGAQLQRHVGRRLLENLEPKQMGLCLDLGCGPGLYTYELGERFNSLISLDLSLSMLKENENPAAKIQADGHALPILSQSVDSVFSSLMIQWCDLDKVLAEVHRVLKPGGQAVISTLVSGTLFELKTAWSDVDEDCHVHQYLSQAEAEQAISQQDWHRQETKAERQTFWFDNARGLAKELKHLGANYVGQRHNKGLMTKRRWLRMESAYAERFLDKTTGQVPATYQVLYLNLIK